MTVAEAEGGLVLVADTGGHVQRLEDFGATWQAWKAAETRLIESIRELRGEQVTWAAMADAAGVTPAAVSSFHRRRLGDQGSSRT